MAECAAGTPGSPTDTKSPLYAHACSSPAQDTLPDVQVARTTSPRAYVHACVHMPGSPAAPLKVLWPSTLDGPRQRVWEGGGLHFEKCRISKGHSTAACVCVCVCHRVITSWTKLGFQGCWCQLALLWSTARPLFRFLTFPLWATSPLLHISHTGGTRRLWPHTHTYITSPTRECVCKRARERSEYSESPAPKHSKQLSYDQWVRHYLWFIWVAPQTILTHSPYSVRLTLFLAYSERSNSDKTALGNIVVILLLLNLRRGKTPSLHRGLLHFRWTCDVQLVAVTPPRTITAGGLQLYCITLLTAS